MAPSFVIAPGLGIFKQSLGHFSALLIHSGADSCVSSVCMLALIKRSREVGVSVFP